MSTRLEFEGSIAGVKIGLGKPDYNGALKGGGLELTLKVEMPPAPQKPHMPWHISNHRDGAREQIAPRPAETVERKKNETDEKFNQRLSIQTGEVREYDKALAAYQRDVAKYEREAAVFSGRMQSYALLVGVGAVFANQSVNVVITPSNQDMLPGISMMLLPPVEVPDESEADRVLREAQALVDSGNLPPLDNVPPLEHAGIE